MDIRIFNQNDVERGQVVILGFFDCLHKGHLKLIGEAKEIAARAQTGCALMTFKNNPFAVLRKNDKPIYTFAERCDKLVELGIESVIAIDFDRAFMSLNKSEFEMLLEKWSPEAIVCGYDFSYGCDRGSVEDLAAFCRRKGILLRVVGEVAQDGERVSSSRIRRCLADGDMTQSYRLLGEFYRIKGEVCGGRRVGRKLGFPTVNLVGSDKQLPKAGVYGGLVEIDGTVYAVAVNIGAKPTFGDLSESVEGYILGYSGELYGQSVTLGLAERIRDVVKFDDFELLKAQLARDTAYIAAQSARWRAMSDVNQSRT
ncbi:MAG: riboflavin biosynthesis protein RibF [Clostridia bacterium]|nr:riboflavin biosynthesis protein RibF [Clostridia bacterium]